MLAAVLGATACSAAPRERVIYDFCDTGICPNGSGPTGPLTMDGQGNLYGTTSGGGGTGAEGTVFELTPGGQQTVLYAFPCAATTGGACPNGAMSLGGVLLGADGNFYGTTSIGGSGGGGTVFQLTPAGQLTVLYNFCAASGCGDGAVPFGALIIDAAGNLYGTTFSGGRCSATGCGGVVFRLTPSGQETVLYQFCTPADCSDGEQPMGNLVIGNSGKFYGTTPQGGLGGGVLFVLTPVRRGREHERLVHSFIPDSGDGVTPNAGLIADAAGNLYGTTSGGGAGAFEAMGTMFRMTPRGHETVLHSFCNHTGCTDGGLPQAGPTMDAAGNLYGTTAVGGANDKGVVFELTADGAYKVLSAFCARSKAAACADGAVPQAPLVVGPSGRLYGTTSMGGRNGGGVVFEVTP